MPTPSIPTLPLTKLQKQLSSKTISPALITKMKKAGIQTLQDIRKAGGVAGKENLSAKEIEAARHLEAHAYLNLLSEDVEVNEKLINAGISSFGTIAGTNKASFLKQAKGLGIPEETATTLHAKAEAAEAYLTHIITAARAEKASYSGTSVAAQALGEEYDQDCEVKECNSAVSPLAYLMELLVYAKDNINGLGIKPFDTLEQKLYQPFERFTNACEEVDRKVRQVRIATEVLRKKGYVNQLEEKEYCFNAYKALLTQIGTSYDELRRIKSADAKKRQALADRLGIPLRASKPDELDMLLMEKGAVIEDKLEEMFGLQDTRRYPILKGILLGDQGACELIKDWRITNHSSEWLWGTDGRFYGQYSARFIKKELLVELEINLLNQKDELVRVASGQTSVGGTGKPVWIQLEETNNSGISAEFLLNIDSTPNGQGSFILSVQPTFLAWRLQYLRQQWQIQDSLSDAYINKELPVIDPDLIGPEDFRHPINNDPAFKLWKKRREWVDERLSKMSHIQGFAGKLLSLNTGIIYQKPDLINPTTPKPITPWTEKVTIEILLQGKKDLGDANLREGQLEWIQKHKLKFESFSRLAELALKVKIGKEPLLPEEWAEVDSILVQAQKNTFQDSWVEEEVALGVLLVPLNFWKSLQEPEEGLWSPLSHSNRPLIDPEIVKFEDLVPYPVGKLARAKWEMRKVELDNITKTIGQKFSKDKLKGALNYVYDKVYNTADWQKIIDDLWNLLGTNPQLDTNPQNASRAIWSALFMSVEGFQSLYGIVDKLNNNHELSDEDVSNLLKILTSSRREKTNLDDTWENDEASLSYWQIFRSCLPKWRASREERSLWQIALKSRSRIPIIDPDMVLTENIKSGKASVLFITRQTSLNEKTKDYEGIQPTGKLEKLIVSELGISHNELLGLEATAQSGTDITKRLDQLSLSYAPFARLLDLWKIKDSLEDSEWEEIYNILLQVLKDREYYPKWHSEEQAQGITLSPDFFELTDKPQGKFISILWRSTSEDRYDWEDKLQNRIDQEKGTYAAMAEAVDKAEERTIAQLRDALVKKAFTETVLDAKAVSKELLVDMEISPCQKTTRISVAITTLQKLFFQLRMDEPITSLPNISLCDGDFDTKWKWLGSYETWRAVVGVFLYPENVLLPSLSRIKTPMFDSIIKDVRSGSGITPAKAQGYAQIYADYFEDICTLENVISTTAPAKVTYRNPDGSLNTNERTILFKFGIGGKSKQVYWSYYDEGHKNDLGAIYSDSFWDVIPGMENIKVDKICGAPDYKISDKKLYLLLFVQYKDAFSKNKFSFFKFDLEIFEWDAEPIPLATLNNNFIAVIQQDYNFEHPPMIIIQDLSCANAVYARQLNLDISDWEEGEWIEFMVFNPHKTLDRNNTTKTEIKYALSHASYYPKNKALKYKGVLIFKNIDGMGFDYYFADNEHISAFSEGIEQVTSVVCKNKEEENYFIFYYDSSTGHEKCKKISEITLSNNIVPLFIKTDNNIYYQGYIKESDPESLNGHMKDIFGFSLENLKIPYFSLEFQGFRSDIQNVAGENVENISSFFSVCCKLLYKNNFNEDKIYKWVTEINNWLMSKPNEFEWNDSIDHSIDWEFYNSFNGNRFIDFKDTKDGLYWSLPFSLVTNSPVDKEDKCYKLIYFTTQVSEDQITKNYSTFFLCPNYGWHAVVDWDNWNTLAREQNGQILRCKYKICENLNNVDAILSLKLTPISNYFDIFSLTQGYEKHRQEIIKIFESNNMESLNGYNDESNRYILQIIKEAFYFVPMFLALELANKSYYNDALDWFRSIYDFQAPKDSRKIYYGLELEAPPNDVLPPYEIDEPVNFIDPTDVHSLATAPGRYNSYTRFTLQSIIQTLLQYADSEFTRDTPESIEKALLLYEKAKELLDSPELHPYPAECKEAEKAITTQARMLPPSMARRLMATAKKGNNLRLLQSVSALATQYAQNKKAETLQEIEKLLDTKPKRPLSIAEMVQRNGIALENTRIKLLMNASIEQGLSQTIKTTTYASGGSTASLYFLPKVATYGDFPVPWNPLIQMLYLHAENNLNKIRNCRNIAGIKREIEAYAAATDVQSAMPSIGAGGQLVLPTSILPPPVPYRYEFVIDRAKQLVNIAVQMENAFLSALEKKDAGLYEQLKARQDLQLAQAGVKFQNLRLRQAKDEIGLAELQKKYAETQFLNYDNWLQQHTQEDLFVEYYLIAWSMGAAAILSVGLTGGFAAAQVIGGYLGQVAGEYFRERKNLERSREEWEFQRELSSVSIDIGDQQIKIANDGVDITEQEVTISKLQVDQAKDIIEFLREKDTSAELYDWMQGILKGIYSYFLQQATAMAKLAQNQLAFERQEPSPGFIQHDYWVVPSENAMGGASENATDRFGLTGSARLLADIYKLDQYHFDTEKRKLQLTKNISLAKAAPFELQRFRETGVITFQTLMQWFDRDFPGHYLRMIKRVRTSVVALVPPTEGIKATLSNIGVSRIVTERNGLYQTIIAHRPPESVALTSPSNATGLFELESQNTSMMLPFEGLGVDSLWEFRMPKVANQFDYNTIADIILSIDYTALDSYDYRLMVIESLPRKFSGDRPYSFRYQFADAWYDLHNPDQSATPMTVTFRTRREDFPPNLERVTIQQVLLYFALDKTKLKEQEIASFDELLVELSFLSENDSSVGGTASPVDGIISTRRGNGSAWIAIQGAPVSETWTLSLSNNSTSDIRKLFAEEKIEDMLLLVTFAGLLPEWPE